MGSVIKPKIQLVGGQYTSNEDDTGNSSGLPITPPAEQSATTLPAAGGLTTANPEPESSSPPVVLNNRSLKNGSQQPKETALNPDGTVKEGWRPIGASTDWKPPPKYVPPPPTTPQEQADKIINDQSRYSPEAQFNNMTAGAGLDSTNSTNPFLFPILAGAANKQVASNQAQDEMRMKSLAQQGLDKDRQEKIDARKEEAKARHETAIEVAKINAEKSRHEATGRTASEIQVFNMYKNNAIATGEAKDEAEAIKIADRKVKEGKSNRSHDVSVLTANFMKEGLSPDDAAAKAVEVYASIQMNLNGTPQDKEALNAKNRTDNQSTLQSYLGNRHYYDPKTNKRVYEPQDPKEGGSREARIAEARKSGWSQEQIDAAIAQLDGKQIVKQPLPARDSASPAAGGMTPKPTPSSLPQAKTVSEGTEIKTVSDGITWRAVNGSWVGVKEEPPSSASGGMTSPTASGSSPAPSKPFNPRDYQTQKY